MKLIIFALLTVIACSHSSVEKKKSYVVMNQLWDQQVSRAEIMNIRGKPSEEHPLGITYLPNQSNGYMASAHFFDEKGILKEQLIIISENELHLLKKTIPCKWNTHTERQQVADRVGIVEFGSCPSRSIFYGPHQSFSTYEVRWKRP